MTLLNLFTTIGHPRCQRNCASSLIVLLNMLLFSRPVMANAVVLSCTNNDGFNSRFQVDPKAGRVVHLSSYDPVDGQSWNNLNVQLQTLHHEPGWIVVSDNSVISDRMLVVDSLNLTTLTLISKIMIPDAKNDLPGEIYKCVIGK